MTQFDFDARKQRDRDQARAEKAARELLRADVQALFNSPAARRVLALFLEEMGLDASPFSPNAMTQSLAIGRQDAARWWLQLIRDHCPEREQQIRIERQQATKPTEEDSDEH